MGTLSRDAPCWALGTMSGTSMDGIDAALVRTDGQDIFEFGQTAYAPYAVHEQASLRAGQGCWAAPEVSNMITQAHVRVMSGMRAQIGGFHGQTLAHDPRGRGTYQAGDGAALADALNMPIAWDFRTRDVEMGGQGAPLVPFFHHSAARWARLRYPVAFVNIGGIANLTYVRPDIADPCHGEALLAFDTGPGNAILDDLLQGHGMAYDHDGEIGAKGQVVESALATALSMPYFDAQPPKSLDRNAFAGVTRSLRSLALEDALATGAAFSAASIAAGLTLCPSGVSRLFVSGGGRKNATIMGMLQRHVDIPVETVEAIGLDGDFLEAQAMGYLAMRVFCGLPLSSPTTTGAKAPVVGGRMSYPKGDAPTGR